MRAVLEVLEQYENGRVRTKDYGARKANSVRDYIAHVKAAGFELRAWTSNQRERQRRFV